MVCGSVLLGMLIVTGWRFVAFKSDEVHYHANFALYLNGKRDEFKSFAFYEEVQACVDSNSDSPKTRVHMHDRNNGLIHAHETGMTWGYFFANLGYTLGDAVVATGSGSYVDGQDNAKLSFVLNGTPVTSIAGKIIKTEDRLLINYGNDDKKTLEQRYNTVPTDARKANTEHDPSTCSGGHELNFWDRLKKSFLN